MRSDGRVKCDGRVRCDDRECGATGAIGPVVTLAAALAVGSALVSTGATAAVACEITLAVSGQGAGVGESACAAPTRP